MARETGAQQTSTHSKTNTEDKKPAKLGYAGMPVSHMERCTPLQESCTSPHSQHRRKRPSLRRTVCGGASQSPLRAAAQQRPKMPHRSTTSQPSHQRQVQKRWTTLLSHDVAQDEESLSIHRTFIAGQYTHGSGAPSQGIG
ncbi:Hypothetical predicted protein [Pelobates cultripes]|uniref:Uncharacterized protein n=1 Tax=Pelobates cultripes TaxID=61616 RepID=A0AAD1RAB8_PELCU|nr:Hypothetical predicted protein [Pelobates cultripes]